MPPGPMATPFWGFLTAAPQRHLQRALSAFAPPGPGLQPRLQPPHHARVRWRGSSKTPLPEKEPIPRLRGSRKAQARGPAVREAAYKRSATNWQAWTPSGSSTPIVSAQGRKHAHKQQQLPPPATRRAPHV